ncbi:MAG TPA: hypothetical protein VF134_04405 [Candidatus Dormibacteraeota bacterium]
MHLAAVAASMVVIEGDGAQMSVGTYSDCTGRAPVGYAGAFDASGDRHPIHLVAERTWNRYGGPPPPAQPGVTAQFQTCISADAGWDRILDGVDLDPAPRR